MDRKTTTYKKRHLSRALAALAVVVGAGMISAAPARADHGPDVGFSFSFGFPAPFVPVPVPVVEQRVYYGPPVFYGPPPVYYREAPVYYPARPHKHWRHDRRHDRHDRWERNRWERRDARW